MWRAAVPGDVEAMAQQIQAVIGDVDRYRSYCVNARGRVEDFFQLHEVMSSYNKLYRMLGNMGEERNFEYTAGQSLMASAQASERAS